MPTQLIGLLFTSKQPRSATWRVSRLRSCKLLLSQNASGSRPSAPPPTWADKIEAGVNSNLIDISVERQGTTVVIATSKREDMYDEVAG